MDDQMQTEVVDQKTDEQTNEKANEYVRIGQLLNSMSKNMGHAMKEIQTINMQMRMLSFNSQIEAARAGEAGKAFSIVSGEMKSLAEKTSGVTDSLQNETHRSIQELSDISKDLATNVRGVRLSDLSLNNIDLIDRNLYERSCDVRWWATDGSLVDALKNKTESDYQYASKRLGVILSAYTVYIDLVLCDTNGRVVANGRPREYASKGADQSRAEWFREAMSTSSGEEYGFETVHESTLVNGRRVLAYSCTVRRNGEATGEIMGVLGILFDYDSLAQTIMYNTPLSEEEKKNTRVCIVDKKGLVLADSENKLLTDTIDFSNREKLFDMKKGFIISEYNGAECCIAHAFSPGFETYSTGWHSLIIQSITS